ncbi:MAG: hypothetical protein M1812_005544 [Candelaria pacifica]|nr:MAG: hypothetical protein M1812_005544 [Candelaria pacifica]
MLASCGHHQGNHGDAHPPPFRHGSSTTIPSSQSSSTTRVQHYRSEDSINHVELDHISDESAGLDECTDSSTMPHPQSVIRLNDHTHKGQTSYALEEDCAVGGPESENRWVNGGINNTSWLDDDSASDESESEASVAFWRCEGISEPLNQEDTYEQLVGGIQELAITSSPTKPLLVDIPQRARTSQDFEDLPPAQATNVTTSDLGTTPTDSNSSHKTLSLSIPVITPPETPTGAADLSPELEQHTIPLLNHKNGPDSLPSIYVEAAPTPPTTPGRSQGPPSTIDLPTVLTMLEAAVKGFPFNGLHLEAPIIHLLRSSDSFSAISTAASSPSSSGITWPYSPSFGSTQDGTTLHSPVESKTFQWPPPSSYDSEHHLVPLRKLFPKTEDFFRNDLYAHFLAVTFIDKLPCPKSPLSFITAMPEITSPKALKMLGIAPIRLEKESVEIRVRRVKNGLMTCVGRLLEAMCGKSRSDGDEALIALMDQIVGTVEEGKTPSME